MRIDTLKKYGHARQIAQCIEGAAQSDAGKAAGLLAAREAVWENTGDLTANKRGTAGAAAIADFLETLTSEQFELVEAMAIEKYGSGKPSKPEPSKPEPFMPELPDPDSDPEPDAGKPDFSDLSPVERAIAETLYGKLGTGITREDFDAILAKSETLQREMEALREEILANAGCRPVTIHSDALPEPIEAGLQHRLFPRLLRYIARRQNVWMTGPAGSMKTTAARNVARTLVPDELHVGKPLQWQDDDGEWFDVVVTGYEGESVTVSEYSFGESELVPNPEPLATELARNDLRLAFFQVSLSSQASRVELTGFRSPVSGNYVTTQLRIALEHGAVFCLDEIDATNPNILVGLNETINVRAGEAVGFPDGMVTRNRDFVAVATANTVGAGQTATYAGTMPQNGASKDRFVYLDWNYDEDLERSIVGQWGSVGTKWFEEVILPIRKAIRDLDSKAICSPRMTFGGAEVLAHEPEENREQVQAELIHDLFAKKIDPNEAQRILATAGDLKSDNGWS